MNCSLIWLLVLLTFGNYGEVFGIKCYQCIYERLDGVENGNPECNSEIPESLLVECEESTKVQLPMVINEKVETYQLMSTTLGGMTYGLGLDPISVRYQCGAISVSGETELGEGWRIIRSCIPLSEGEDIQEACKTNSVSGWNKGEDKFSMFASLTSTLFTEESVQVGCPCEKDGCNNEVLNATPQVSVSLDNGPREQKQCFVCGYAKGGWRYLGSWRCHEGSAIPKEYAMDCDENLELPVPVGISGGKAITLRELKFSQGILPDQDYTWGCGKITYKGRRGGQHTTVTVRTCVPTLVEIADWKGDQNCRNTDLGTLYQEDSSLSQFEGLIGYLLEFSEDSRVQGSYCDAEKCNYNDENGVDSMC